VSEGAHRVDPMLGTPPAEPAPPRQEQEQERSLGDIVSDVATDLSTLVKQEMELARTELKQEAARAGKGAGLLGGAGVAGHLLLISLTLTIAFLLDNWMPVEVAFLITTLLWAIIAGVLAMTGRTALRKANPQLPQTQQTLKEDAAWARAQKS
jgi:uncharacterized membrane protein YqjE